MKNPLFSRADLALDVELELLAKHYHPRVARLALRMAGGEVMRGHHDEDDDGEDPLEALSTMSFLRGMVRARSGQANGKKKRSRGKGADGEEEDDEGDEEELASVDEFDAEREIGGLSSDEDDGEEFEDEVEEGSDGEESE